MSLNGILSSALTGLQSSQAGLRTTSNNISNVNTPGYARQDIQFSALDGGSGISGVQVDELRRVTDQFLVSTQRSAVSNAAASEAAFDILDRAQATYGDPTSGASLFDNFSALFQSFGDLGIDPSSAARRSQALSDVNVFLNDLDRIGTDLQTLRGETDARVANAVDRANALLAQIPTLNQAARSAAAQNEATGAQDTLSNVLDELADIISIRVVPSGGGVEVRTPDGLLLANEQHAVLSYGAGVGAGGFEEIYPAIEVAYPNIPVAELDARLTGGELQGLIQTRDGDLPEMAAQLGEFAAAAVGAINAVHNDNVAFQPPTQLTGKNTGLLPTDRLGFTGQTTMSFVAADGALNQRVDIDFDAGTFRVYQPGATAVTGAVPGVTFTAGGAGTIQEFMNALDAVAPPGMSWAMADGQLSINGGTDGVAFTQDATTPSSRGGQGFSQFFGLNDLISAERPMNFATGVAATDAHNLAAGGQLELTIKGANGAVLNTQAVDVTASGATWQGVIDALNAPAAGFAPFGTFSLTANGEAVFTPDPAYAGADIELVNDTTRRVGVGNLGVSDIFGIGDGARTRRATILSLNSDIEADARRLALGRLNPSDGTLVAGQVVTGSGDGAGAQALQVAANAQVTTAPAGGIPSITTTPQDFAGRVASDAGLRASAAERSRDANARIEEEAGLRRASVEGVNIEEELVRLTQYQQSFQAASRLIQAAQDLTDTLLSIV